ncbi:hypothetical protein B0H19DRAFT_1261292 [Mycena capillaripes]|nr:hypothetical protein B0H19DRAFT_1261292 [Mycena capillaripes]
MATGRPRNTPPSGTIPVINRATSTRAQSKITQNSQNLASTQGGSSSGGHKAVGQSAPQAVSTSAPSYRQVSPGFAQPTASSVLHALPTHTVSRGVSNIYAGRSVQAMPPLPAAPSLPLHMEAQGKRGPLKPAEGIPNAGFDVQPQEEGTVVSPCLHCYSPVDLEGTRSSFEPSSVTDPSDLTETGPFDGPVSGSDGCEGSIEQGTSITAALRAAQKGKDKEVQDTPFFSGYGTRIDLYLEDLPQAVERYHILFDPTSSTQEDPLIPFGVHHGEVSGKDTAATELLRDTVIRYQHRNKHFSWDSLS